MEGRISRPRRPDGLTKAQYNALYVKSLEDLGIATKDSPTLLRKHNFTEEILKALPCRRTQVGTKVGLDSASTGEKLLLDLHAMGWVHIGSYEFNAKAGKYVAVYHEGPGEDVEKPEFKPDLEEYETCMDHALAGALKVTTDFIDSVIQAGRKASPFDGLFARSLTW